MTYRMASLPVTFGDAVGNFCCFNLSVLHTSRNTACIVCYVLTRESESARDFLTYTVNVVISRKRCQIASLLLQTTNRK